MIVVFAVAAVLRVGWVAVRHGHEPAALSFPDEYAYQLAGRSLAAGEGLIDEFGYRATYMPGYPAFIAIFERFGLPMSALRITQALLAALVAPATFLLARQWVALCSRKLEARPSTGDRSEPAHTGENPQARIDLIAFLAGLAAAFDPFLVFFSGLLLTEALFAVALVAVWWLTLCLCDRERSMPVPLCIAAGVALLACVMLRPSSTILIPLVPAVILPCRWWRPRAFVSAAIVVAVVYAGLLPWALRNARLLGEWRWTTTRGGISLYDGLQPGADGASDLAHTKQDPKAAGMSELEWDAYWRSQAVEAARQDPARVLSLAAAKLLRTWNIVPNEPGHRRGLSAVVSAIWMSIVLVTAVIGLWQARRHIGWVLVLLAPVLAFTALHMIFVGSVRYRIPLMPMLFVLSAAGIAGLIHRCRSVPTPASAVPPATTGSLAGDASEDRPA